MRRRTTRRSATLAAVIVAMTLGLVATVAADDDGGRNRVRLQARMDGAQETQAADTDGRGRAKITLNAATNQICWEVDFSRIGAPNRGHIHIGAAGTAPANNIVFPLFELVGMPADPLNDQLERGKAEGCGTPIDLGLIAAITANPSNYYVNLHNPRFPAGAIRGQLGRGGGDD